MSATSAPARSAGDAGPGAPGPAYAPPTGPRARPSAGRRTLGILGWVAVIVVGGVLIALATGRPAPGDYLHPDGTGPQGTRALVEVLRAHGIEVDVVDTAAAAVARSGPGTTVVIGGSDLLTSASARRVLDGTTEADRVVLLDGAPGVLPSLGLGVRLASPAGDDPATGCTAPWAEPGDVVTHVSWAVVPDGTALPAGATGCFRVAGPAEQDSGASSTGWAVVDLARTPARAPVTVVGVPDAATNRFITDADNAGVMLRLLGGSPRLVWLHPTVADLTENPAPEGEAVWPAWLGSALAVVAVAFVLFALARGRRLGRLVPEPLPVVVRAAETSESRAELYRAAADRPRAALVLRLATGTRLATRLGLPATAPPHALVPAVADATGVPADEVARLLTGPPPTDDEALVTLAQQLAHLEEKARRP